MGSMRYMDRLETRSKLALSTSADDSDETTSDSTPQEQRHNAKDFMTFMPWACAALQLQIVLELTKAIRMEKVSVTQEKQVKGKSKLFDRQPKVMLSESDMAKFKREPPDIGPEIEGLMVRMVATFTSNTLTHVKIQNTKHIPRQLIKILSHISHFYPNWSGITISSGADQYIIYDLCTLIQLSHITEVYLDNTFIPEANYYILLDQPNNLKVLSLSRCKMGDTAFIKICSRLEYPKPASKCVVSLSASTNLLSDDAANAIAKVLRTNRKLIHLNLANNYITDEGVQTILESLNTFLLTEEECKNVRGRYFKMLEWQLTQEIKRLSDSQPAPLKTRTQSISKRRKSKKLNIRSKDLISQQIIPEANPYAFDHQSPFMVDCFRKDGMFYNKGNNTLAHLSLAYNKLSYFILPKLLHVLENQKKDLNRNPRGLVKIVIEGNPLPKKCKELSLIDDLLYNDLLSNLDEVSSARRISRKKSILF